MRAATSSGNRMRTGLRFIASGLMVGLAAGVVAVLPAQVASAKPTFTVNLCSDTGSGSGTAGDLLYAVTQANANPGSAITFDPSLACPSNTITLSSTLDITSNVSINGPGASVLAVSGNNAVGVFSVGSGVTNATISGLTIENGDATGSVATGGGIDNSGVLNLTNSVVYDNAANGTDASEGGGIANSGTMTITDSTVSDNSTALGGGIFNAGGTLNVTDSTVSDNHATVAGGGGIANVATANITDSTVSGNTANTADGDGGGVKNVGTLNIANSTFNGNSATFGGGAIANVGPRSLPGTVDITDSTVSGNSDSIQNFLGNTITIAATIVANSTSGSNCDNSGTISDLGYNLEDDAADTCGFSATDHDIVGQNPDLGPLKNNGGSTDTMALLAGSPAIGLVNSATLCATPDQRGFTRPSPFCDSGAYETVPPPCPTPVITGTTAVVTCSYVGTTAQTWTAPAGVTQATFDVFGAQGGSGNGQSGGDGGETKALLTVTSGTSFDVVVAGAGEPGGYPNPGSLGGFGGGGAGGAANGSFDYGAGGGGGSSVSAASSDTLLLVAGGGGGNQFYGGGAGGGLSGTPAATPSDSDAGPPGLPGTQLNGGTGTGGAGSGVSRQGGSGAEGRETVCAFAGSGGGGGYFGGSGGGDCSGGGGGSGYATTSALSSTLNTGVQSGNGVVTITYTLPATTSTTMVEVTPSGNTAVVGNGASLTDFLTVTGMSGGPAPTNSAGGVDFYVCQVSTSTTFTPGLCPATGTPYDATEILSGVGDKGYAESTFFPTGAGTWCFSTTYSGDSNYVGSSDNTTVADSNECALVSPASPAIATTPSATSVTLGSTPPTLTDTAVLSGGYMPTGTITFTLYNPGGTLVATKTVTVSGNGSYPTPTGYTLPPTGTDTGTYQWDASYASGNANNKAASENNAVAEQVKVVSPCGSLTAYFLSATYATGSFTGLFCVSASGTGTYSQSGGATGAGEILVSGSTTWISASGKGLALLGEKSSTIKSFTETAPAPMKAGTFTLSPLP